MRRQRDDHGQILVIFAGGLVLLLAISALVVDVGFILMLRRQEQNAADPAAVAAARHIPTVDRAMMWTAACFYASQNGFVATRTDTNTSCVPGQTPDGSRLTVNYPPSPAAAEYAGKLGYVEVTITKPTEGIFGGVIGLTSVDVASSAVAAFDTGQGGSSSLVALRDAGCEGQPSARVHGGGGSGGVYIFPATGVTPDSGGYVQVNSDCGVALPDNDNCFDGSDGALSIDGGTTFQSNTVYIQGICNISGGSVTIVPPTTFDEHAAYVGDPLSIIRPPEPTDLPTRQCPVGPATSPTDPRKCNLPGGATTLEPGTYYGGWAIGNGTVLTLNPGIYILAGGGISQTGGVTAAAASGRVMIYSTDSPVCGTGSAAVRCQQKLDFTGSSSLNLRGLDGSAPCPPYGSSGCPFGGLLFWQDANASGAYTANAAVELEGNGSLYLEGTIYAPTGDVKITGNSVGTGCTPDASGNTNCAAVQIISWTWDVGGAGRLEMPYDPNAFVQNMLKGLVR